MGCLIDRLTKKQASAVNFNLDSIRTKYHDEFTMVSEASKKLNQRLMLHLVTVIKQQL